MAQLRAPYRNSDTPDQYAAVRQLGALRYAANQNNATQRGVAPNGIRLSVAPPKKA